MRAVWLPQIEYSAYKTFAELRYAQYYVLCPLNCIAVLLICRIDELFDILVEFPDSEPALLDLRDCLMKVELRTVLINNLQAV